MTKLVIRIVVIGAVVGTLVIITLGLFQPAVPDPLIAAQSPSSSEYTHVGYLAGNAAPNFTLTTFSGEKVSLSDYRGKLILLNFWNITCASCLVEMPELQKVYEEQQAKGFVVLGIELPPNNTQDAHRFVQKEQITYPILADTQSTVRDLYNIRGLPTSFVIDRKGIIRTVIPGPISAQDLQLILKTISL